MRISDWSSDVCSSDLPARLLLDTNLATQDEIVTLAGHPSGGTIVYAPPPAAKADVQPETLPKRAWQRRREPAALKEWRERMAAAPGQEGYARRSLIETANGQPENQRLAALMARGRAQNRRERNGRNTA